MMLRDTKWGAFTITSRRPAPGSNRCGGWQASCPYHRKNATTGCKRYFAIQGPRAADRDAALHTLLHWCVIARGFSRQRSHLSEPLDAANLMPVQLIMEKKLFAEDAPARRDVRTDIELDAMEAAAAAAAGRQGGRARGRGRGRGRAGRQGRRVAVAARAAAEPAIAASAPSISSSSSQRSGSSSSSSSSSSS